MNPSLSTILMGFTARVLWYNGDMNAYEMTTHTIDGRLTWLALPAAATPPFPTLYMPTGDDFPAELEGIEPHLRALAAEGAIRPFAIAAFASGDWNRDFSPWPAPALFKKAENFAGKAPETLAWLMDAYLPHVEASGHIIPGREQRAIMGYSLAGLFSLWACTRTEAFAACASCSGSLWYDGWADYMQAFQFQADTRVYLSLGDREGRARNQRMAAVEPITRATLARLQSDPHVTEATLQWHEGGHFDQVDDRQLAAMRWLMRA